MKTKLTFLLATAAVCLCQAAPLPPGTLVSRQTKEKPPEKPYVSLNIGSARTQNDVHKTGARRLNSSRRSGTVKRTVESVSTYECTVSCKPPKGGSCDVTVEAFFVELSSGGKGVMSDKIFHKSKVGSWTFTSGQSNSAQKFTITSPKVKRTKTTRTRRGSRWSGGMSSRSRTSGSQYRGCFIRAICNGEIVAVRSSPSISEWDRAGKMPNPVLKKPNAL